MFDKVFIQLLEKDMFNRPDKREQSDRQGPTIGAKNQQVVPDVRKADATEHPKVEMLREKPHGQIVLHKLDVNQITDMYGINNLSTDMPRQLGNSGITIQYNPQLNKYTLVK